MNARDTELLDSMAALGEGSLEWLSKWEPQWKRVAAAELARRERWVATSENETGPDECRDGCTLPRAHSGRCSNDPYPFDQPIPEPAPTHCGNCGRDVTGDILGRCPRCGPQPQPGVARQHDAHVFAFGLRQTPQREAQQQRARELHEAAMEARLADIAGNCRVQLGTVEQLTQPFLTTLLALLFEQVHHGAKLTLLGSGPLSSPSAKRYCGTLASHTGARSVRADADTLEQLLEQLVLKWGRL